MSPWLVAQRWRAVLDGKPAGHSGFLQHRGNGARRGLDAGRARAGISVVVVRGDKPFDLKAIRAPHGQGDGPQIVDLVPRVRIDNHPQLLVLRRDDGHLALRRVPLLYGRAPGSVSIALGGRRGNAAQQDRAEHQRSREPSRRRPALQKGPRSPRQFCQVQHGKARRQGWVGRHQDMRWAKSRWLSSHLHVAGLVQGIRNLGYRKRLKHIHSFLLKARCLP